MFRQIGPIYNPNWFLMSKILTFLLLANAIIAGNKLGFFIDFYESHWSFLFFVKDLNICGSFKSEFALVSLCQDPLWYVFASYFEKLRNGSMTITPIVLVNDIPSKTTRCSCRPAKTRRGMAIIASSILLISGISVRMTIMPIAEINTIWSMVAWYGKSRWAVLSRRKSKSSRSMERRWSYLKKKKPDPKRLWRLLWAWVQAG